MTILGIGVDVVHIPRIVALANRRGVQRFVSRILSPQELSDWNALPANTTELVHSRFLAVRWSVKEAAYKAMYPEFRPTWKELTYTSDGRKPLLLFQPRTQDAFKLGPSHVSVSHDGDYVFASVVLEAPYKSR